MRESASLQLITSHLTSLFRGAPGISRADRHWRILLSVMLLLNVFIFGFSMYFFLGINRGELFLVNSTTSLPIDTIDRTKLQETLSAFEERRTVFEKYQKKGVIVDDPSL